MYERTGPDGVTVMRTGGQIVFGSGVVRRVGELCARLGARVFVCVDPAVAEFPVFQEILKWLAEADLEASVYAGVLPELPQVSIEEAIAVAKPFAPDVILAIGGGSCIDLAKVVSLKLTYEADLADFYGEFKVPGPVSPVVAVPTTSGTGSEVTPVAVVGDPEREIKVGISSPYLIPRVALCDPNLTLSCPRSVSAYSGLDALAHAIEAYTAIRRPDATDLILERVFLGKNRLSDDYAIESIWTIARSLTTAVNDGADPDARTEMMFGSMLAGLSFGVAGTNLPHAIQYSIGAATKTPHGLGVGLMLPYALRFNLRERLAPISRIAAAFGFGDGTPSRGDAVDLASHLQELSVDFGVPRTLRELGVEKADLPHMAEQTLLVTRLLDNNARLVTYDDLRVLLEASWSGELDRIEA